MSIESANRAELELEHLEVAWTTPQYSREELNEAGRTLVAYNSSPEWDIDLYGEYEAALPIINNWRSSHSYPLNTFQTTLRRYARKIDEGALIAQRIKRLSSISAKLERFPDMKLSQMQDIGGCRAVVKSMSAVRRLAKLYGESDIKHKRASMDDYITKPPVSGYRGIHLVYRYFSDKEKTAYNGLKIEIQLRSQYQHAWATAVETVGTFVQHALKSSFGPPEWLRFFALMGTAIALRERGPVVPNTPTGRQELAIELKHYANHLDVANRLRAYGEAMKTLRGDEYAEAKSRYYLLVLDPVQDPPEVTVSGFKANELQKAQDAYLLAEKSFKDKPGKDAVLVSVDSLASLERAYPNYFADTRVFLELMEQALSGKPTRIITSGQLKFSI